MKVRAAKISDFLQRRKPKTQHSLKLFGKKGGQPRGVEVEEDLGWAWGDLGKGSVPETQTCQMQ